MAESEQMLATSKEFKRVFCKEKLLFFRKNLLLCTSQKRTEFSLFLNNLSCCFCSM